jgi:magnesium transporter
MQFELTSELLDELKRAIDENNVPFLKAHLNSLYPQDIAIIINRLNLNHAAYIYELLDEETSPRVLLELDDDKREDLLATFSSKQIAEEVEDMDSDDAAD